MKEIKLSSVRSFFGLLVVLCISKEIYALSDELPESNDELVFAHILFRHGDRSIFGTYPTDPWKNEWFWPSGLAQLTNLGKQQHYELGGYLRRRYQSLLVSDGSYNRNNIYVQSTDVDRTLMSAAHNLAGMFPPSNRQIWDESLMWQAIPIHTIPEEMDHVLSMKRPCPLYEQTYYAYQHSPEIKLILKNKQTLVDYLEMHIGTKIKKIEDVKSVYQALWVEQLKGFRLPDWTEKVFFPGSDMEKLAHFWFAMSTNTKLLARLKAGFLIREILERFTMKKDSTLSPNRSLWIYSVHDSTISDVLNTLGLFEPHIPGYASCIFFELHKSNGSFHVEVFYKRDRGEDRTPLEPLDIPDCGPKCPLAKMFEVYADVIPTEEFDVECRLPSIPDNNPIYRSVKSGQSRFSSNWIWLGLAFYFLRF